MSGFMSGPKKTCLCHFCGNSGNWQDLGHQEKTCSASSSMLERGFQENQRHSAYFSTNIVTPYEGFRRELGYHSKYGHSQYERVLWQFSGRSGNWHDFLQRNSCSVSSKDIEAEFRCNPHGSMTFNVNGDRYQLNFLRMTQMNLKTGVTRTVRRLVL